MIKNNKFFMLLLVSVVFLVGCQSGGIPEDPKYIPMQRSEYTLTRSPRTACEAIDVAHFDTMYGMPVR